MSEVGVGRIQQNVNSTLFDILNDPAVVFGTDIKIVLPSQRRMSDNGPLKVCRVDWICIHYFISRTRQAEKVQISYGLRRFR